MTNSDPIGITLAEQIASIRAHRRMTFVELSARLAAIGQPIPILGLRRIERRERQVSVADLLALALALDVAPVDLIVPATAEHVAVTATVNMRAAVAREWIRGEHAPVEAAPDAPDDPFLTSGQLENMEQVLVRMADHMPRVRRNRVLRQVFGSPTWGEEENA